MLGNIFYFKKINKIGGTEQFLLEIAKKYSDLDITVFYDYADPERLLEIKRYVRCQKRIPGQKIECEIAFFNFNIDMIEDVEAKDYIFVCHGIYQELGYKPPINHPKITKILAVSKYAAEKIKELVDECGRNIEVIHSYNPLTIERPDRVIHLISATRLDDKLKGSQRTIKLINSLDRYARENDRSYLWLIFSNHKSLNINSPNVVVLDGRVDIRPFIADSDYLVQLSDDMETYCYSINEALSLGVPVVATPLSVLREFYLTKKMYLKCDWDMGNVDEIAEEIFTRQKQEFSYKPPRDKWRKILYPSQSDYHPIVVRATDKFEKLGVVDKESGTVPKAGQVMVLSEERYNTLIKNSYGVEFVERKEKKC